ncbi:MAG: hypothetical protein JST12_06745 [Armatimonadetes bacterium]|nr:hypothetical protein [Armatimonadota bacterium]
MSNSVEICNLLNEAAKSGVVVRIRYPGHDKVSAKVGEIGSDWVELATLSDARHKGGERWFKIALIQEVSTPESAPAP